MSDDYGEKWLLEEGAALALVEALNLKHGLSYEVVEHKDRPDTVIADYANGMRIGVEITHFFHDSVEARMIFGRSVNSEHPPENIEDCIRRLNALLLQKARKAHGYNHSYPLGLLVRVVSTLFKREDFLANTTKIHIPPSDYQYIWLLFYDFYQKRWSDLEQLR